MGPAKTAEQIELSFGGGRIRMGPRRSVRRTYGRHLANTFDRSVLGDDAGGLYTATVTAC